MVALDIQNLCKTYANGVVALDDVNLQIDQGDFIALLGPNGAGKTTIISILNSLVLKSQGRVNVFGFDLDNQLSELKSCIGTVPQEFNFNIFETVYQIVSNQAGYFGLSRRLAKQRTDHYLKKLSLWNKRDHIARSLSGGMKRRLMIARALVHEPKMLILDEPTAGVDIEVRHDMWQFLSQINQAGTTIMLTTHYLEEAERLCKNVAIIHNGRLIEHSSTLALLQKIERQMIILEVQGEIHVNDLAALSLVKVGESSYEVCLDKQQSLNRLMTMLDKLGVQVLNIRNKTNRLEEMFLQLTQNSGVKG